MQHVGDGDEFPAQSLPWAHDSGFHAARILVVDDDPGMRQMLVGYFRQQNVDVVCAAGREETLRHITAEPSVVALDLRLGDEDGLDLLREIRSRSDVPVIITTGHRRDDIDRIVGLELGADDYLIKPFNPRELLARVRAVLRRQSMARAAPARGAERGGFLFDEWRVERRTRRLTDPQGNLIPLTKSEYALLVAFLEAPGRVLSREYLLQATRMREDIFDRTIDVQVLRLRKKLESVPNEPRHIRTERGVGYIFATPVERF
jgi:two-component system, OmpR family, response regulator